MCMAVLPPLPSPSNKGGGTAAAAAAAAAAEAAADSLQLLAGGVGLGPATWTLDAGVCRPVLMQAGWLGGAVMRAAPPGACGELRA